MANVRIREEYKVMEQGKERYNMCKAIEDMIEDGRIDGRIKGKIEAILELLEDFGQVPARLVEHIREENNPGVLSKWLKAAAKASSIAEFEANM